MFGAPLYVYLHRFSIVYLGSEAPFERMQPALMLYVKEDLLQGKEATHENINVRLCIPHFSLLSDLHGTFHPEVLVKISLRLGG